MRSDKVKSTERKIVCVAMEGWISAPEEAFSFFDLKRRMPSIGEGVKITKMTQFAKKNKFFFLYSTTETFAWSMKISIKNNTP
jgi:hypothetical protein